MDILFLIHRIPYPPNKGDKIRSFNWLKHLAQAGHRIHVGAFIDDPKDVSGISELERYCETSFFEQFSPTMRRVKSLPALVTGKSITQVYYGSKKMAEWVKNTLRTHNIDAGLIFSSSMAQYLMDVDNLKRVIDFVDVDSEKWTEYGRRKGWPGSFVYKREGRLLACEELEIAQVFDSSIFVSEQEADLFKSQNPAVATKVTSVTNGVNVDYFDPSIPLDSPYSDDAARIVFVGALDYWANVEGVEWFCNEVYPKIRQQRSDVEFHIVGSRPSKSVVALAQSPGVHVHPDVDDVRPYLKHAAIASVPLRIARGIQNKVLEALAMEKPVLASSAAFEGVSLERDDLNLALEDDDTWPSAALDLLQNARPNPQGRDYVIQQHGWKRCSEQLLDHLVIASE